jgi:hypothetical protein
MGIEEHFVTADIRAAWAASPIGQERVPMGSTEVKSRNGSTTWGSVDWR